MDNAMELSPTICPNNDDSTRTEFALPPVDRGKAAYLVVLGGFIVEALVWGFAFTFGLFQDYYTNLSEFRGQESQVATIGTAATGLMYLSAPVALGLCRQYPQYRRQGMFLGAGVMTIAFIAASFSQNVTQLIATQGILYAIGGSMIYYPVFLFIDEWFVVRKGLALGIMWASSGFGGLTVPYVVSWSLEKYGFRGVLRIWAVVNLLLLIPAMVYLKPRLPSSMIVRVNRPRIGFAMQPLFLVHQLGSIVQSLGCFVPGIYLPSYTRSLGMSSTVATTSVALLNVGTFLGCVTVGFLVDRWRIGNVLLLMTIGATLAVTIFWGLAKSAGLILTFALFYGFFAGSYTTAWPGVVKEVLRIDQTAEANTIFCLLVAGRGVGNIVSGPLSQALLHSSSLTQNIMYGYGSMYGALIVFVASTTFLGGLGSMYRRISVS